jgi:replication initiation protein RepC
VPGGWEQQQRRYEELSAPLSRKASVSDVEALHDAMAEIRADLSNQLEKLLNSEKMDANDRRNGQHIQNSHPDSQFESEPRLGKGSGKFSASAQSSKADPVTPKAKLSEVSTHVDVQTPVSPAPPSLPISRLARQVPLAVLLSACPQITDYGPQGRITTWKELLTAAVVVRTMLNVSTDAYDDACTVLGHENAASVIACILERADCISSPGGYLRVLTARARHQAFSVAPMVAALRRARGPSMPLVS